MGYCISVLFHAPVWPGLAWPGLTWPSCEARNTTKPLEGRADVSFHRLARPPQGIKPQKRGRKTAWQFVQKGIILHIRSTEHQRWGSGPDRQTWRCGLVTSRPVLSSLVHPWGLSTWPFPLTQKPLHSYFSDPDDRRLTGLYLFFSTCTFFHFFPV